MDVNSLDIISKSFSRTWNFEHQTISSHFHLSNGLVEREIQTVKRIL